MYPANDENAGSGNSTTQLSTDRESSADKLIITLPPSNVSKVADSAQITEHINSLFDQLVPCHLLLFVFRVERQL